MPKLHKQKKSKQPHQTQLLDLKSKVDAFITHAKNAELAIRENYGKGCIPPDFCGEGWNDQFALAYEGIQAHLPSITPKHYQSPPSTAYQSFPFKAESAVQAWMFLLNPADMAYGEPGYLDSTEYQEIKIEALKLIDHLLNPPLELFLTETEIDLVKATTETPQTTQMIAIKAECSWEAARKYLPRLRERGLVMKANKNGYYRLP